MRPLRLTGSISCVRNSTLLRYVITGLVTAAVYFVIGTVLYYWLSFSATWATSLAFVLSVALNYLLHYHFTFSAAGAHLAVFPKFIAMITGGGIINWCVSAFGFELVHTLWPVQLASIIMIVLWNFAASYLWVFKR